MTSRRSRLLVRTVVLGVAGAALAGCAAQASSTTPHPATLQAQAQATSKVAWADEGARLRQFKHDENLKHKPSDFPGGQLPGNSGDWAYQSLPIDITSAGRYTLTIPVPQSFNYPTSPYGFAFESPPDAPFRVAMSGTAKVYVDHGQKYLTFPVTASGNVTSYGGYTAWIF